jgi:hypothetical protein
LEVFTGVKVSEFPGLDGLIKLNPETPAFDPLVIEEVYFSKLDWEIDRAINILKYRLAQAGITEYEMVILSHSNLPLTLQDEEIKSIDEDNLPPKTIYILTTKIGEKLTIRPLDKIGWQEFFLQSLLGKQPRLTINPLWAQARIRWK